jgi:pimeloyl-ACP methyl ester carboxylesterase
MQLFVRGAHAVGVRRLIFRFGDERLDTLYTSNKTNTATNDEFAAVPESSAQARDARLSLGSKPLIVITAGNNPTASWETLQLDLQKHSSNSRRIVAVGSGHYVHDEQPDLVIDAIRDVVEKSRR